MSLTGHRTLPSGSVCSLSVFEGLQAICTDPGLQNMKNLTSLNGSSLQSAVQCFATIVFWVKS